MMPNLPRVSLAFFLAAVALARPAAADDKQTAKDLFEQGVAKMEAKKYDDACPAIERSLQLDPYPGTLFALAECEALRGRPAAAFKRYGEYLELYASLPRDKQLKQGTREKDARAKRAELDAIVARATLTLPAGAPVGTVVTRDGVPLADGELGAALLLDPGEHVFTVEAPGSPPTEQRVTLVKGEKRAIELEAPASGKKGPAQPPSVVTGSGPSGRRVAAFVTGGVGAAGLVLGGVTGGLMLAQMEAINAGCKDAGAGVAVCTEEGAAAGNDAKTFGLVATAGLAAGLALVGVGVVLYATEPGRDKATAAQLGVRVMSLGPLGTTLGVRGSF